ncbi:MAG: hypothetical protein AAGB11_07960 [Pseudomonadota bacterium]
MAADGNLPEARRTRGGGEETEAKGHSVTLIAVLSVAAAIVIAACAYFFVFFEDQADFGGAPPPSAPATETNAN